MFMVSEEEVKLSDELEAVEGPEIVVSAEVTAGSVVLVDVAVINCEEEALASVEEGAEDRAVCVVEESEKVGVKELPDNDSEADGDATLVEVGVEIVETEMRDASNGGSKLVEPDKEVKVDELLDSAEDSDSEDEKISNAVEVGLEMMETEVVEPDMDDDSSDGSKLEESDEISDNGSTRELDGVGFADRSDDEEKTEFSEETVESNELDMTAEIDKIVDVDVMELSEEPIDLDGSPGLEVEPPEDVGVPDDASDSIVLEELERTKPSSGGWLELVDNGETDGSIELEVEAWIDRAFSEVESVNASEKLDELDDVNEPKELRVSVEDETPNELDKLDSAEGVKEVDRTGELVSKERLEDVGEIEELEDSSTLAKDCCATMIVPGRLPDGKIVEIGRGVVRNSVPEYGTVDVTKRSGRAKIIVPGAVPLGCIVVMGIVPVMVLGPE
ncbi:hypothetical protein CGRA01v4_09323 [Colletotrichum graminicola]|uniref:Uncharacterized protein n=1 Tax=Colletotrichum graminicola (strain M1.001 / M2 / FGSC 10212) TaxID=645133 RepID=E3QPF1_COLGM|nr:uncharacterized protein GLRG_07883 [Colletotrichum graminicola M1.001]EFQ32739.1 hypothetical protein GLRG_07883 [Colletotrichum graminicola M1.001]WDK18038.1 hypothetical protein CGRA01v4_09323 [Colletotrichum graminicola]